MKDREAKVGQPGGMEQYKIDGMRPFCPLQMSKITPRRHAPGA